MLMSAIWLAVVTIIIYHDFKSFLWLLFWLWLNTIVLLWGTRCDTGFQKGSGWNLKMSLLC